MERASLILELIKVAWRKDLTLEVNLATITELRKYIEGSTPEPNAPKKGNSLKVVASKKDSDNFKDTLL